MKYVLDDIKAKNEERRKKKENKIRKYTEEIRQKKTKAPTVYGDASKNFGYKASTSGSFCFSGSVSPYVYTKMPSAKNLEYGNFGTTKGYGSITPSKTFGYGTSSPTKTPAYGVVNPPKNPSYVNTVQNFSSSASSHVPKNNNETPASSGPDYYNK